MDVVRFCLNSKFLEWFLDFDPPQFFATLRKLFTGKPLQYLKTQDEFIFSVKQRCPHMEAVPGPQAIL